MWWCICFALLFGGPKTFSTHPCTIHWKPIMPCIVHPQLSQGSTLVTCQTIQLSISSTYGNYLWELVNTSVSRYLLLGIPGARAFKTNPFVKLVGPKYRNCFTKLMPSRHRHKFYFPHKRMSNGVWKRVMPIGHEPHKCIKEYNHNSHHLQAKKTMFTSKMHVSHLKIFYNSIHD